jgi:4-amino-4-deoxy-L-arabinose transferase-like glycosyltransferase
VPPESDRQRLALLVLLALLFTVYASSFPGIRNSNEGSHYALVRSLAKGELSIDGYEQYTRFVDFSARDGRYYSDKPPGVSVLALPLYGVGRLLAGPDAADRQPLPNLATTRPDPVNGLVPPLEEWWTNLLAALGGTLTVVFVFLAARELGAELAASTFVAAAVGLGTMVWRYATILFAHSISAALVMAAVYLALRAFHRDDRGDVAWLGAVAGVAVAVDYSNALLMAGVVIALVVGRWGRGATAVGRDLLAVVAGAALPILLLAAYQWGAFGSPLHTSYRYKQLARYAFSRDFFEAYSAPITNLGPLLFQLRWGVVAWCPLLVLTPVGLWFTARRSRPAALLLVLASAPLFVLIAKFLTPEGGATHDARYVTPALAPLVVSLAVPLTDIASRRWRRVAWAASGVLVAASVLLQGTRLLLMPAHRERMIGGPAIARSTFVDLGMAVRAALRDAFPSIRFAPIALALGLAVAGVVWATTRRAALRHGTGR